tara:strand:+ start:318 stop:614 length:297 start_codon:yes stop_codon:yes gene_type:complete
MDTIDAIDIQNLTLTETVEPENDLKNMLVEYVGEKLNPEDRNVTVEMIVETLAEEFPEFLMVVAEENFIRGYHQALADVEIGEKLLADQENDKQKENN